MGVTICIKYLHQLSTKLSNFNLT